MTFSPPIHERDFRTVLFDLNALMARLIVESITAQKNQPEECDSDGTTRAEKVEQTAHALITYVEEALPILRGGRKDA